MATWNRVRSSPARNLCPTEAAGTRQSSAQPLRISLQSPAFLFYRKRGKDKARAQYLKTAMEWKILPIYLLLLSVFLIQQASSQDLSSCAGRCGEGYSRDATCNCDYNCQHYMECCPDFKKECTVELSCKGRCFESFARGRECDCDSDCKKYGKCCSDYGTFCEAVHNPTPPPPPKTAPPPPGASQTIKSTTKRSPKSPNKKKTKKVIESEEITEEHSVSENQESSSSSSSSSSTIRKIKSSKNSADNRELKKKPKEPTPKALGKSPKEPAVPTIKAPKVNKPEMTTTVKDKSTEKDIHPTPEITTAVAKIVTEAATKTEKATESKTPSTTTGVTSTTTKQTTSSKITPKTTLAPKVMTATKTTTKKTANKPEKTTAVPKGTATNSQVTTPKPQKPTKAPKKPTSTKKPTPRVRKPKTTPTPPKMTSVMPEPTPTSLPEAMLQTTTSPTPTPNSEIIEVNPKNEDGDAAEGEKPHVIFRPPVLTPIVIPGTEIIVRGHGQGFGINPMFSDETNLCNGRPVDGLTTLRNGTLVAFRGHYFWMLTPFSPPPPPRRITEVWGIPSPIDTVFTRCNCEGKTFFFKGSQYWRFTNDIKDAGYPKLISKGFGGLNGKIVAALSIAQYKNRPESVYFFKRGGSVQQYTYKQEPTQKCTGRRPAINYSVYGETAQVRRRRFERAIGPSQIHTIRIHYSPVRVPYQDKGFLHNEVKVSTLWRGLPNVVTSAISLPNVRKPDGYDYYAFSKDQYYNIDVPSRTARAITTRSGQTLSNTWYKCP
ncbi:hypothetical protein MJT46_010952 [Ovis ammon polii x Ovis aries]|nr:hypothetical protein MJT46_010952 [Ovis ammon polii x Ovis aries]